jgi:hypothetical protein
MTYPCVVLDLSISRPETLEIEHRDGHDQLLLRASSAHQAGMSIVTVERFCQHPHYRTPCIFVRYPSQYKSPTLLWVKESGRVVLIFSEGWQLSMTDHDYRQMEMELRRILKEERSHEDHENR